MAMEVSTWSKITHSQQGCVAVSSTNRQFTVGYNGLPKNYTDTDIVELCDTVHAELNCIINAGRDLTGWSLYVTKAPCLECAKAIASAGIVNIWSPCPEGSWKANQQQAIELLGACNIIQYTYGELNGN